MKPMFLKLTALLLALLLTGLSGGCAAQTPASLIANSLSKFSVPSTPGEAAPPASTATVAPSEVPTVPLTLVPAATAAPTTIPAATVAPTSIPVTTVPPTTVPPATTPPTTVPPTTVPSGPLLHAEKAFVYHCGSGEYSYIKGNLDETTYPASITKLMSIYVGLMYLQPEQTVTVGNIVTTVPADSSFAYLYPGDTLTVKDLVAALLLPSGNDAAQVWAVEAGRAIASDPNLSETDARAVFIAEMNRQAPLLGLTHSHFITPDGYHEWGHYSSMADLCKLAQLCLEQPLMCEIMGTAVYTHNLSGRDPWKNTNLLIQTSWPGYYKANAIGLKTGNTGAAGNCVLSAFQMDDEIVIIGVFRSTSYTDRFEDALKLYDEYA